MQVLYIQQFKNQSLLAGFPILQTHLLLHVMTDDQYTLCYGGELSTKLPGRYKCHIWIKCRPYITILMFLIYIHNVPAMFHLHPQPCNNRLETFHLPETM